MVCRKGEMETNEFRGPAVCRGGPVAMWKKDGRGAGRFEGLREGEGRRGVRGNKGMRKGERKGGARGARAGRGELRQTALK